ncbi:MAG: fused MFS/spermidine synthase, partial [Gammaproteobacteria bacterium]
MQQIDKLTHESHIPDWALLATVFVTGGCVLIIELMGTRILAPYFGSGIYTWSALIAITLAALALGYSFGGRLADRLPKTTMLYSLCLAAGLWTLSTPMLARA